jgi:4-hydroxy-tetrahydrodipicolinate synthase
LTERRLEVVVALLTPLERDGSLDVSALAEHVELLVEAGVDAVMPCGTTGEGPLLSEVEVERTIGMTCEAVAGRARVLAHVGRADTASTLRLTKRALSLGANAVSAVVPYYYALTDEQILRHFRAVLEAASGSPLYAYTIPARTGNDLSVEVVCKLAAEGLTGVKDSMKSLERNREYVVTGVDVLTGTDALVLDAFRGGAAGCVSAVANVRPDLLVALRDGGAEEVQAEISALRDELRGGPAVLKRALAEQMPGYPTAVRAPLG